MATPLVFTQAAYTGQVVLMTLSTPSSGPTAAASGGGAGLSPMILCDGRLLPIASYQVLHAVIGATYGGDAVTTFAVPRIAQPAPNIAWFICANGYFPSADPL
jgi:hypothetical protein